MPPDKRAGVAEPAIAEVLEQFLAEQQGRLAPRTFAQYRTVIQLLEDCLNGYASQTLDKAEARVFDRFYRARGTAHREFCEIFGPEHILPNVDEFLGYFMIRKVMAGKDLLRAAGTVTKKLAGWLAAQGYAGEEETEAAVARGTAAARDLPGADELASLLADFAEEGADDWDDEIEDQFAIKRVEQGKIWIEGLIDGRQLGPIAVPEEISERCRVGWWFSGVVGRRGRRWRLVETWNVYPRLGP